MKKSMNLIDRVKSGAKTLAVGAAIGLSTFAYSPKAEAGLVPISDLIGNNATTMRMAREPHDDFWNNLKIKDSETGIISTVPKDGGSYNLLFYKQNGDSITFGAYMTNDNGISNNNPDLLGGWLTGAYDRVVFSDGSYADGVLGIYDGLNNGVNITDGALIREDDDIFYFNNDIIFNGIRGDVTQIGPFNHIDLTKIVDAEIVIDPVPEPRTGPSNMVDLEAFAYYWLSTDCMGANGDCEGADWNYDGTVNLQDFAYMAQGWDLN